nr:probable E3 ubiquitin-protein ligase RHG1A [Coffea arabica]XP_027079379.1 probable E3 ubiquitin-protein ligase RHG1A [Coffea arabica]
MDEFSGKRHRVGVVVPRKGSRLVSRDTIDKRDQNAEFCNRLGCNGRLKYGKSNQSDCADKSKNIRPSCHSSNGKQTTRSSPETCFPINNGRKSRRDSDSFRKSLSNLDNDSAESCGVRCEPDVTEHIPLVNRNNTVLQPDLQDSSAGKVTLTEVGSSSTGSSKKSHIVFRHKPPSGCQNPLPGPSVTSVISTSNSMASGSRNYNGSRYGLRNLRCNSISDVIPRGGSASESKVKRDVLRKRSPEAQSSTSSSGRRGSMARSEDGHVSAFNTGISVTGSRHGRSWVSNSDSHTAPLRTRKALNSNTRIGLSNLDNRNALLTSESSSGIAQLSRPETPNSANLHSLSYQSSMEGSSNASSSCRLSARTGIMSLTPTEHGITHALRRHNLNGVAEVLLALERIGQDEEYEHLLALENDLFLGHLNFYDQHRDMRLDIDNMSYEELLALEERMGTVSTAFSEEAFAKCITKSIYQTATADVGAAGCSEDEADIRCSICQEEYVAGDEIGKLGCEHGYHLVCIHQWLRLKNWCPICKASAAPSQSSLSS